MTKSVMRKPIRKKATEQVVVKRRKAAAPPVAPVIVTYPREGLARVREAAEFLKIGLTLCYSLIKDGKLETTPVGNEYRIKWPSLWAFYETGDGRLVKPCEYASNGD